MATIVSDYPLVINGDESKTVSGRIGSGQAKISLIADVGESPHQEGFGISARSAESSRCSNGKMRLI